ncbi:hypothetical protein Cgig2_013633 [Carnegiea gigantea]|uniref:Uncharacterized protein n=1 Tax=Carnegiea gigantea TaxID=171969 RepID=A0A9Q1QG21_9CARY|nr:hypothetical protein Cgig2_013633 [Carnegiea gigantea]
MPPASKVDFRAPSNFTFASANGPNPSDYGSFNTGSSSTSSSSSFAGRPAARPKPGLSKQRSSKPSSTTAAATSGTIDSGINPYRSVSSQSVDASNLFGNFNGQFDNVDFVFGVSNLNKVNENANPLSVDSTWLETDKLANVGDGFRSSGVDSGENDTVQKEELKFSQSVGEPCLNEMPAQNYAAGAGKVGLEFELSNELKKLNIENVETVQDLKNTDVLKEGDQYFVFTSGAKSAHGSIGSSVPWKSDVHTANSDESTGSVFAWKTSGGFGPQPVNEKIFPDISSFQSQFSDEVKAKGNENASSFSSSLGAKSVSGEPEACTSAEDREVEFGFVASSSDFKLLDLDASLSFAANLVNGLSCKLESGLKMRVPRENI